MPELICFRYNPGPLREGSSFIGDPREAKYGVTTSQIRGAYMKARELGAKRFGMHTMVVSNMLDEHYLIETAVMLFKLAAMINHDTGFKFDFINLGGGFGTPYKPEQKAIDLDLVTTVREYGTLGLCQTWKSLRDDPITFPMYSQGVAASDMVKGLGSMAYRKTLLPDDQG